MIFIVYLHAKFQFIELKQVQTLVGKCTHNSKNCTHYKMVSKFRLFTG